MAEARTTSVRRLGRPARIAIALLWVTIAYNVVEGVVAITAGIAAGSVSLTGFGFDSAIEVASAIIVLHRLSAEMRHGEVDEARERRALKAVAITFFALALYLVIEGVRDLAVGSTPETSIVGIVLTALSVLIMPTLARYKGVNGERLGSSLVVADAAETKLCSWLSVSTLISLVLFAIVGWTWLDPVAGFVIAYFAVREGREAWEGDLDEDDDDD